MARKTIIVSEDDLTGGPATELVHFAIDNVSYEIDLNDDNAKAFRDALQPYTSHGRRTSSRGAGRATSARSSTKTAHLSEVRQWARDNGHTVSDRGRIPQAVLDAYETSAAR